MIHMREAQSRHILCPPLGLFAYHINTTALCPNSVWTGFLFYSKQSERHKTTDIHPPGPAISGIPVKHKTDTPCENFS